MGLPKFEKRDGTDPYIWEEYPSLPSDRSELAYGINQVAYTIEHTRNEVIIERELLTTKNTWTFFFYYVEGQMITELRTFFQEGRFRYYPDSDNPLYFDVYWINDFKAALQRGGRYNINVILLER